MRGGSSARIVVLAALIAAFAGGLVISAERSSTTMAAAATKFVASLREPPIAGDETSTRTDGMPPYNVYGADGDVTGDLVYLNYGMQEDYKDLARRGIEVKGRIVIARYGNGWRGLKPKLAQQPGTKFQLKRSIILCLNGGDYAFPLHRLLAPRFLTRRHRAILSNSLGRFPGAFNQLHLSRVVLQREVFRTSGAQPEMFDIVLGGWKSKEPASIEAHQKFGAVRVGTLRDHGIEMM